MSAWIRRKRKEPSENVSLDEKSEIKRFLEDRDVEIADSLEKSLEQDQDKIYRLEAEIKLQGNFKDTYGLDVINNSEISMYTQGKIFCDGRKIDEFEKVYREDAQDAFSLDYDTCSIKPDSCPGKAGAD